jgi:hypothetical protein
MSDDDPLRRLRELPLPPLAAELSARIRKDAHRRLSTGQRARGTEKQRRAWSGVLAAAAVVLLCVSHLGWTVAFLTRMHEQPAHSASER